MSPVSRRRRCRRSVYRVSRVLTDRTAVGSKEPRESYSLFRTDLCCPDSKAGLDPLSVDTDDELANGSSAFLTLDTKPEVSAGNDLLLRCGRLRPDTNSDERRHPDHRQTYIDSNRHVGTSGR